MAPSESGTSPSLKSLKSKAPQRRTHCFQPDNLAGFEIMPYRVATNALSAVDGLTSGRRQSGAQSEHMLLTLRVWFHWFERYPFVSDAGRGKQFRFQTKPTLGHRGAAGSVLREGPDGSLFYYGNKIIKTETKCARQNSITKVDGDIYGSGAAPTFGASGLGCLGRREYARIPACRFSTQGGLHDLRPANQSALLLAMISPMTLSRRLMPSMRLMRAACQWAGD